MRSRPKGIDKMGTSKAPTYRGFFFAPEMGVMATSKVIVCTYCTPGHNPHPMQCNRASEREWFDVTVTYLGSDIFELKFQDGQRIRKHNHDPGRLIRHLEAYHQFPVRFQPTYRLLGIKSGDKVTSMFDLSDNPIQPCLDEDDENEFENLSFHCNRTISLEDQ